MLVQGSSSSSSKPNRFLPYTYARLSSANLESAREELCALASSTGARTDREREREREIHSRRFPNNSLCVRARLCIPACSLTCRGLSSAPAKQFKWSTEAKTKTTTNWWPVEFWFVKVASTVAVAALQRYTEQNHHLLNLCFSLSLSLTGRLSPSLSL